MRKIVIAFVATIAVTAVLHAQELPADMRASIDKAAADVLAKTGAPSPSVAVVRDGKIVYEHAYGVANLETKLPASAQMGYSIGSITHDVMTTELLDQQEVHSRCAADARRGGKTLARRQGDPLAARPHARRRRHHPADPFD